MVMGCKHRVITHGNCDLSHPEGTGLEHRAKENRLSSLCTTLVFLWTHRWGHRAKYVKTCLNTINHRTGMIIPNDWDGLTPSIYMGLKILKTRYLRSVKGHTKNVELGLAEKVRQGSSKVGLSATLPEWRKRGGNRSEQKI